MPDSRLPTEAENIAPLSVLCTGVSTERIEVLPTERIPNADKARNRVLNELSWASVSTNASESELNDGEQSRSQATSFDCLVHEMRSQQGWLETCS